MIYDIQQIVLTEDYLSVWVYDDPPRIETEQLHAIGVAIAKEIRKDGKVGELWPCVVALSLDVESQGWVADDECSNFAGMCRKGDDPTKVTYSLDTKYYEAHKKAVEAGASHARP